MALHIRPLLCKDRTFLLVWLLVGALLVAGGLSGCQTSQVSSPTATAAPTRSQASPPTAAATPTSSGAFKLFDVPGTDSTWDIAVGKDGNLWFTEYKSQQIGRITPQGTITEFPVPNFPLGIAAGKDGNLWFTETRNNKIGRITPQGAVTEFPLPGTDSGWGITAGPDGNVWFTEEPNNQIGRITPTGVVTEFSLPKADQPPQQHHDGA